MQSSFKHTGLVSWARRLPLMPCFQRHVVIYFVTGMNASGRIGFLDMQPQRLLVLFLLLITACACNLKGTHATWISFLNSCSETVWPASQPTAGKPPLGDGMDGFELGAGERKAVQMPAGWAGRVWGRTGCDFSKPTNGAPACLTGDCAAGSLQCGGSGGIPPVTIFEITLAGYGGQDFYDVSLVDGYNVQMLAIPKNGSGNCTAAGCVRNVNVVCPTDLQVKNGATTVACKSACAAFGSPEYCCTGAFATPQACSPTDYSKLFKAHCPTAYSYAYDDASSTFTCTNPDGYYITFCPHKSAIPFGLGA